MRSTVLAILLLTTSLAAQANDYAGLRIFSGATGAPATLTCGTAFTCMPAALTLAPGTMVMAITLGAPLNGLYAIAASFDVPNLGCIPLGIPGLLNNLVLSPASLITVSVGSCATSDNGRCNGGTPGALSLFTIPLGFPPGSLALQAVQATPLSAGGTGLALSNAVILNW